MKKLTDNDIIIITFLLKDNNNLLITSEMASLIVLRVREYLQNNNIDIIIENTNFYKDLLIYHSFNHKKFYYALTKNKTIEQLDDEYYDKMSTDICNAIFYAIDMIENTNNEDYGYKRNLIK